MVKVKVNTENNIRFTVPVPYSILHLCCSLLTSRAIWKFVNNKWIQNKAFELQTTNIDSLKRLLKEFVKELHNYKGLTLVDVNLHDGTKVLIKL